MNIFGLIAALSAGIFFGFIGPTTKLAYNLGASIGLAIILRYIVGTLLIIPALFYKPPSINIFKANIFILMLFTLSSILLTTGLLSAVNFIDVSLTMLIFATYPIVVLIFSIFINKEKINFRKKLFFFIAFIGIFFVLGPSFDRLNFQGIAAAIIASIGASTMIITNQQMSNLKIDPIHIHFFTNSFNCIFFVLVIYIFFNLNLKIGISAWTMVLIPTIFYTIAFFSQLIAIQKIGQSKTALLLYVEPVVGILGATIILSEKLTQYQVVGVCIVIMSLIIGSYNSKNFRNDFS